MSSEQSRREFLKSSAFAGVAIWVGGAAHAQGKKSPIETVNFACIGVGGKGESDTADAGRLGNIVAICDVDENTLNKAAEKYPKAQKFTDYREMFDKIGKTFDAVTVSTPDHMHAPVASTAMLQGKHCFCQKPLTHSIYEARKLAEIARKMKVATQMGNQGTADDSRRLNVARIKAGALGTVKEVHVWTNRPIWPQGMERNPSKPVPSNLHWDQWLGVAPVRPYADGYHSFAWRGWWDFGTGALGDMACHTVNLPYDALDMRNPTSVVAESSPNNKDSYPSWSRITFEFPATPKRPAIKFYWYDGGQKPPKELFVGGKFEDLISDGKVADSGCLIVGDKDLLYTTGDYGGGGRFIHTDPAEVPFVKSPGHFEEFIRAIKTGEPAYSNFPNYAGPLTETILLGNLSVWAGGKKIEWDAKNMRATNAPEVASIIKPTYRKGYHQI